MLVAGAVALLRAHHYYRPQLPQPYYRTHAGPVDMWWLDLSIHGGRIGAPIGPELAC